MKPKVITTIIEDEVVFMQNPEAEFVSLVKHGANRAPYKILKHDKGGNDMNKVVQAILLRNDLPEEVVAKALEGMDTRSKKEFNSLTSYPQCEPSKIAPDSYALAKTEDEGVYLVLGDLAEGQNENGTITLDTEKEAIDYATMDNLYFELYAMADLVGGVLRQETGDLKFKQETVLTAIDNFRSFAEAVLSSLTEKTLKAIDPADHPTLVFPLITEDSAEETSEEEEVTEKSETEEVAETETAEEETPEEDTEKDEVPDKLAETLEGITTAISSVGEAVTNLTSQFSDLSKKVEGVEASQKSQKEELTKSIEDLRNTTEAAHAEVEETPPENTEKENSPFKGLFMLSGS
jgi:hypothetical protein